MRMMMAVLVTSMAAAAPAAAADVTVKLTGVKPKGGELHVALYDDKTFLRTKPPFLAKATATPGEVVVVLKDVPAGDYAIAALHDADGNGKMTAGANGPMGEGTAMSNGEALRGMPTFAVTKVAVPAAGAAFTLPMSYPEDRRGW